MTEDRGSKSRALIPADAATESDIDVDIEEEASKMRQRIWQTGSEMAGQALGAALGTVLAGPVGAGAGAAVGVFAQKTIQRLREEFAHRQLSLREQKRVNDVLEVAKTVIKDNLEAGHEPRNDGFFDTQPDGRSPAEEILEGVLIAAQRDHEERKIPFMGRLMANLAFDSSVDRTHANYLVKIAANLSYTGMCILGLIDNCKLREGHFGKYLHNLQNNQDKFSLDDLAIVSEIHTLQLLGLLSGGLVLGYGKILRSQPPVMRFGLGDQLFRLMELNKLEHDTIKMRQFFSDLQQDNDSTLW